MAEILINTGRIELDIKRDGKKVGVFTFNPSDINETKKHAKIVEDLEESQKEQLDRIKEIDDHGSTLDSVTFMEEFTKDICNKIDVIYGDGTSDMLFGDCLNVDTIISFFNQLQPYYASASEMRKSKYKNK